MPPKKPLQSTKPAKIQFERMEIESLEKEALESQTTGQGFTQQAKKQTAYERREKQRQAERESVKFDLSFELRDFLNSIIDAHTDKDYPRTPFSKSKMVEALIIEGILSVTQRQSLYEYFELRLQSPKGTIRFQWDIDLPAVPDKSIIKRKR